ncbi:sushi domain-containing protein 2-like [Patiria miniata]|uniref:Sushi domain-containing protein 2-like n=1 Tax=Patiria miniata TaxID=46514 RepID=A0A913Z6J5_PATMI|nr:sushi domain-containing protein 2-like [Patiria miniata]XP_038047434.1 sushi domain-containing protein 2-like [Patiria miniata]
MKPVMKRHLFWLVICMAFVLPEMPVSALDLQLPGTNQPKCSGISRGKRFIIGFTDNTDEYSHTRKLYILVVAFSNQQTSVTISSKFQVDGEQFQESFVIEAGGYRRINVPAELIMNGNERSVKGIEIRASSEVSAYGLIYQDYTTDGFLGIPTNNLGMQYVIVTPTQGFLPSQFSVIGTEDSSSVQVTLQGTVTFEGQTYNAGDVLSFMVDKLEAVHIQGRDRSQDLTGSIVQTNKLVSVFSGNECVRQSGSACDTVTEQLVPVKSWGQKHIYTAARDDDGNNYKVVAYLSGTIVTIPGIQDQSLEPGEFWEGSLSGSGLVSSSKPTLMMQQLASVNGRTVDPSFIQVPAEEHFGFVFGFTTPPHSGGDSGGYFNFINIIVKNDSRETVYLNSFPINGTNTHESNVPHTNYISLTVQLPKGEGVYYVEQTDPYSSPLSVIVYGYESYETYGYAAGLSLPSNKQVLSLKPYYLRELGGELFTMTVPCLQTNAISFQEAQCKFSTGFGDVIVSGERTDSYTVVCITPTFYKNGLTSVYVSLDDGESFPYSGIVYVASEEDLPPLVEIQQVNSEYGDGIIDLTSDDPIMFSWDPRSLGEGVSQVTVMMQDTDYNGDVNPVLMEGVTVKSNVLNNGSLMIYPRDLQSLTSAGLSLTAFYLTPSALRRRRNVGALLWRLRRYYGPAAIIVTAITCEVSKYQLKKTVPTGLPPCPCNTGQAFRDLNFQEANFANFFFHPGADNCYRSVNSLPTGAGQQCCYGTDGNILVGPPGGGTADRYSPGEHFWKHQWFDVLPWLCLCKLSNNCKEYYKYRPSDDCSDYDPPRPAGGTGDPHLTSLDGYKFTFNGAGEFLMASSAVHNLTFQSRMERYRNTNASVYTAFVLQVNDSSKVQVQRSDMNETLILIDGEPLRLDSIPVKVHHLRGVRIRFNSDMTKINIAFSAGIAVTVYMNTEVMSFIAQLDTHFQGQVQGLLGNLNGNPADDLQFRNRTILEPGSSLKELHEFGLEWLVALEESIFTYISPFDYHTYHFPEFSPTFEIPNLDEVSQEIKNLCGDSIECVFDAVTTGSLSFANETLVVTVTITEVEKGLVKIVSCGYPGDVENGLLSGSLYFVNATVDVACDDDFILRGSSRLTCLEDGQWSSDLPVCAANCGYPGDVENGLLSGSVYLVNDTVDVACDDGFTLTGSSSLTCLEDGQWSSDLPVCAGMENGEEGGLAHGIIAAIVVGSVIVVLAICGLIYIFIKRK